MTAAPAGPSVQFMKLNATCAHAPPTTLTRCCTAGQALPAAVLPASCRGIAMAPNAAAKAAWFSAGGRELLTLPWPMAAGDWRAAAPIPAPATPPPPPSVCDTTLWVRFCAPGKVAAVRALGLGGRCTAVDIMLAVGRSAPAAPCPPCAAAAREPPPPGGPATARTRQGAGA
jgi:hypothetical protein